MAEQGDFKIYTSTLTIAEVFKRKTASHVEPYQSLSNEQSDKILAFFEHEFIVLVDVDRRASEDAHRFCQQFNIRPNDAIHLACALHAGCDTLLSWDTKFTKKVILPSITLAIPFIPPPEQLLLLSNITCIPFF